MDDMTREEILQSKVFLLDLDGTVYLDETPIGRAAETLSRLRSLGKKLVFLTNNSSKTAAEYREKLTRIGLWGEGDFVYTSGMATADYLKRTSPAAKVFLLGTEALKAEFVCAGVQLDETQPDVCVLAYDTSLTFDKIRRFDACLKRGVRFLATHPDDVCPTKDVPMPDVGSFLALFKVSSGREPDLIVGKPNRTMAEELSRLTGAACKDLCMVGDRMHTDIRFANRNGMKSVLVLSGETTRESMARFPDRPDLVLGCLGDIF